MTQLTVKQISVAKRTLRGLVVLMAVVVQIARDLTPFRRPPRLCLTPTPHNITTTSYLSNRLYTLIHLSMLNMFLLVYRLWASELSSGTFRIGRKRSARRRPALSRPANGQTHLLLHCLQLIRLSIQHSANGSMQLSPSLWNIAKSMPTNSILPSLTRFPKPQRSRSSQVSVSVV